MADLVFGAGTSHSPMLILDADGWRAWAASRDTTMTDLADGDGTVRPYDEWIARNGERLAAELSDEAVADKVRRRTRRAARAP